ncbi:DMT family transporter [Leptospira kanakyensis]|uniref:DMT family transporter n=1 Tax=Leptospira kanakyensis TaxID=2484968 RepID=UPI00223CBBD3|nr:multidrug efflux SMR transporter [Leptospira kanakyensis]MCW7482551.1 multidrug efflux SMR transporter [Leptospira kanakyensis]
MNWILLLVAGLFEVMFAFCLGKAKETTGNEVYLWYLGFFISLTISMVLLIIVTKELPIGTSYAVWTGIGAAGTVFIGILFFKEPIEFWRLFFLFTLVLSVVGLKFVSH